MGEPSSDLPINTRSMTSDSYELRLFESSFRANGTSKDREHLEWQYRETATRGSFVEFAVDPEMSDRLAGIYAAFPSVARVGESSRIGIQSLDTLTDVDHRGNGLFVRLAKRVYERCEEEDVAFVYGFPNGNSVRGFLKHLGWVSLDPVPFLIKPLRSRFVLGQLRGLGRVPDVRLGGWRGGGAGALRVIEIDRFDQSATDIWEAFADGISVAVDRSADYLNWRYVDKPAAEYRRVGAFREGEALALIVTRQVAKHGGNLGYVMELLHRPGEGHAAKLLLQQAVREMAKQRADAVLAWCLPQSPSRPIFNRSGFLPMPERIRPIELHFGARGFDARTHEMVSDRSNWYISYSDSDTV